MKLGTKIVLGFSSLIVIAMLLGALAVWKMSAVRGNATALAGDYMPATSVANDVERESYSTMYEMRGYALTEDSNYLALARQNLMDVRTHLQKAKELTARSGSDRLSFLKEAAEKAESKAIEYEQLANQTVAITEALEKERETMNEHAQQYMKACYDYLESQNTKLQEMLKSTNGSGGIDFETIQDRVLKINLANDIIDLGNTIRVGNFKAQATRDPELFRETQKKFAEVYRKLDALIPITKQEANLKQIEQCRTAGKGYEQSMTGFLKNWLDREELGKRRGVAADAVLAEAKNTATASMGTSTKSSSAAAAMLGSASVTMIVGLGVAALIGACLAYFITASIVTPIRQVADHLSVGADQTSAASSQVSASSQSLAEGASEQAASLEETSSSLEELSSTTQRNAESAQKANDLAKEARAAAERGASDMQAMGSAMEAIKASSDDIAKIIKTIDEIAFQTNILALNAAVEAARAGEAGMGFAVVADEVRKLAQRSAEAAKETAGKIESAVNNTAQGVEISHQVAAALKNIVSKSREVDELVAEVAGASREQTQGIGQINMAVNQIDKVTQGNAANAEESAAAAEELNAQAMTMKDAVRGLLELVDGQAQGDRTEHTARAMRKNSQTMALPQASATADRGSGEWMSHERPKAQGGNGRLELAAGGRGSGVAMAAELRDI